MTEIFNSGEKITYTLGDTFELEISSEDFESGDTCTFIISEHEESEPIIKSTFRLISGAFSITFTAAEKSRLSLGNYIYKAVVVASDKTTVTTVSGDFIVKWGA